MRYAAFVVASGQDHEPPHAIPLLDTPPYVSKWVVADQAYRSYTFRKHIESLRARPMIPTRRNGETLSCPPWIYTNRNQVERLWAKLLKVPAASAAGMAT